VCNLEESIELPRVEQELEARRSIERPPNWDNYKEAEYQQSQQAGDATTLPFVASREMRQQGENPPAGIGIFIQPEMLKPVVCAVALSQVLEEFHKYPTERERGAFEQKIANALEQGEYMDGMRAIFNAVDWLWPVTIGLQIAFRIERLRAMKREFSLLRKLYLVASKVIRGSEPGESRTLYFDLARIVQLPDNDEYHQKTTAERSLP
jgi:hypothetical protein